jgi:uncharacterized membrane protein YgdD (TMEM256/DUF423 family)
MKRSSGILKKISKMHRHANKLAIVAVLGALAVALGALGAHALKSKLQSGLITTEQLAGFETAARYHLLHTLAMGLTVVLAKQSESRFYNYSFWLFFSGIVLFSGSLYLLTTRGITGMESLRLLGPVTPAGGLLLIGGWLVLALPVFKNK